MVVVEGALENIIREYPMGPFFISKQNIYLYTESGSDTLMSTVVTEKSLGVYLRDVKSFIASRAR